MPEAREDGLFSSIASAVCAALETDSNLTSTLTSLVYVEVRKAQPINLPQEHSTRIFMISRCSAIPFPSLSFVYMYSGLPVSHTFRAC